MFINNFDPVALEIFSLEIRWYSLAYIFGILFGWILSKKLFIQNIEIKNKFDDYLTYLIIGIILGGRLGYIFIYNLSFYINNPLDIFKIWEGGMSFHGGLIGVIFASIFFAKKNNQNPFLYMDIVALVAPVGLFFGRIANFINSELYGTITNVSWAVTFIKVDNFPRHPSQLYEAFFEGIVLFGVIKLFKNRFQGFNSGLYVFGYGFFRFFIEYFREPDDHLGFILLNLSMGQLLCLAMMGGAIIIWITGYRLDSKN